MKTNHTIKRKIHNISTWTLTKTGFDTEYFYRKLRGMEKGIVLSAVNTKINKVVIDDILFKSKLMCSGKSLTSKNFQYGYAEDKHQYVEKSIWFSNIADYDYIMMFIANELYNLGKVEDE
jgi:hypothetical protein